MTGPVREAVWPDRTLCLACGAPCCGAPLCRECSAALERSRIQDPCARWRYDGPARVLVHRLKYGPVAAAAQPLCEGIARSLQDRQLPPDVTLTWVPMPEKRRRERGIDHGQCLAQGVAQRLGLPAEMLLRRASDAYGTPQERLNRAQRLRNLQGAFEPLGEVRRSVLLIDDVYTTGATTTVCTQALLAAGAPRVFIFTATKTLGNRFAEQEEEP